MSTDINGITDAVRPAPVLAYFGMYLCRRVLVATDVEIRVEGALTLDTPIGDDETTIRDWCEGIVTTAGMVANFADGLRYRCDTVRVRHPEARVVEVLLRVGDTEREFTWTEFVAWATASSDDLAVLLADDAAAQAKYERAVAACPAPVFHTTHRYCPSCPWNETGKPLGPPA